MTKDVKGPAPRLLEAALARLEQDYLAARNAEAEELHNDLAGVIVQHKPNVHTLVFVLRMLEFEALSEKYAEYFQKPGQQSSEGSE